MDSFFARTLIVHFGGREFGQLAMRRTAMITNLVLGGIVLVSVAALVIVGIRTVFGSIAAPDDAQMATRRAVGTNSWMASDGGGS